MPQSLRNTFQRALDSFKTSIRPDEADDFNFATVDDFKSVIRNVQQKQASQKRMQNLGRLEAFLEAMDQYDKVIQVFLNSNDMLAFIWGPAKFMLMTASTYVEALNCLLDAYEEIGEQMPLLEQYERLIVENPYLQEVLGLLYKDILEFHQKAMRHFRNRTWKQLFHATWKTFRTDFQKVLNNLKLHNTLLSRQAALIGTLQIRKLTKEHEDMSLEIKVGFEEAKKSAELESLQRRRDEETRSLNEEKQRRLEIASWLDAPDSTSDHEVAVETRLRFSTTGLWILAEQLVKNWCDPMVSCAPCLWITGKPGAGKTILASLIIEQCRSIPHSGVGYFYCKFEDRERNNFLAVCRSVLLQITQQNASVASYVYEKASSSGRPKLDSLTPAKDILGAALGAFQEYFLIIDGVDECTTADKDQIRSWFKSMAALAADNSALLRCCFISQDDKDTGKLFGSLPTFKITETHNKQDIWTYCFEMEKVIADSFKISPAQLRRLDMAKKVSSKAHGMFLYAKLVMENLFSQCSIGDLEKEMEEIPRDLDRAYDRLLIRVLGEGSPSEKNAARKLLCWLLCAKRPLKWHEIQGAISFDQATMKFDYENRHLTKDAKRLCGSLIEQRKDGSYVFVHQTAKVYLAKQDELGLPSEDLNLTCLCLSYLALEIFDRDLPSDSIRKFTIDGYYALSDYAAAHWRDHLEATATAKELEKAESLERLSHAIRILFDRRMVISSGQTETKSKLIDRLGHFKNEDFFQKLVHVLTADTAQKRKRTPAQEIPLDFLPQIRGLREVMESMAYEANRSRLQELYGPKLFKCSEVYCHFFHEGFFESQERDKHWDKHQRAFVCTYSGCHASALGYATAAELRKHNVEYHQEEEDEETFPEHLSASSIDIIDAITWEDVDAVGIWAEHWGETIPVTYLWNSNPQKESPLRKALQLNNLEIFERLLDYAPPEIFDSRMVLSVISKGPKRLHSMFNKPVIEIMKEAMRSRQDEFALALLSRIERPPEQLIEPALQYGRNKVAFALLDNYAMDETLQFIPNGPSYLSLAVKFGRLTVVQHLVLHFNFDPGRKDMENQTALENAKKHGHVEICQFLEDYDRCCVPPTGAEGKNIILWLATKGHHDFLRRYLPKAEAESWILNGRLHCSAISGDIQQLDELLRTTAVSVNLADHKHYTPLHHAAEKGHAKCVERLIQEHDLCVDAHEGEHGVSALHLALFREDEVIVRLILQRDIPREELLRSVRAPLHWEFTALSLAEKSSNRKLLDHLGAYLAAGEQESE